MCFLLHHTTRLHNQTNHLIQFKNGGMGRFPVGSLPPGKKRRVKFSRIIKFCKERGASDVDWKIQVIIDGTRREMYLSKEIMLCYPRLIFKSYQLEKGNCLLCIEGFPEKNNIFDYLLRLNIFGEIFGRNIIWNKRSSIIIASALEREDSELITNLRVPASEDQQEENKSAAASEENDCDENNVETFDPDNLEINTSPVMDQVPSPTTSVARTPQTQPDNFIHGMLFLFALASVAVARCLGINIIIIISSMYSS